ncbi:N-acetylmuramoyl-L-alanine amidase family protein [Maribacter sp. CXY002]|uniref:N-acetylmuramoyl-L-alanine amidase family protein n=1 Tax=Maribacter luteocoastalis TaxID=3407671 RepID=UPI003B680FD2
MRIKTFIVILILVLSLPLSSYNTPSGLAKPIDPFVVVLDAGHGGHDPGNLGNGYLEKNIALNIVLKVGEILSANKDIKVVYTRKDDTFIDLFVRGEIANKANADLFVSVHCDSHTSDAHGAGTFVLGLHANKQNFEIAKKENSVIYLEDNYETRYADYDINSPESVIGLTIMQEEFLDQSIALAKNIQDNFSGKLKRNDRKVKQAGFIVLHQTFMPSVLVETGFLTNKDEGSYLNSKKGQSEMGSAIGQAILKYKTEYTTISQATTTPIESSVAEEKKDISEEKMEIGQPTVITLNDNEVKKPKEEVTDAVNKVIASAEKDTGVNADESKPKVIEEVIKPVDKTGLPMENSKIVFKVQLMASAKELPLAPENFKGLGMISKEPFKNLYRYMYGETRSYREAKMLHSNAASSGYPTAYIVAYKEGTRISLPEALKEVSQ